VPYILALDQSTSATKAMIFDSQGRLVDKAAMDHKQYYPQPGWVEHDAGEIYRNTISVLKSVLERNRPIAKDLLCLSITNQRETIVVFDRQTGQPLHHAIVWLCRRGTPICEELIKANYSEKIQRITGLRIDTYFPASKLKWLFDNHPDIRARLCAGTALLGTMDTYLVYRLTRGEVHATDYTNASRTLLYDIGKLRWEEELCDLFKVPMASLPAVLESSAVFGESDLEGLLERRIPICGVMGDSQAALFAERCFQPGSAKVTFGTGSSVLLNIGDQLRFSDKGIVSTIGWVYKSKATYAFEGIINFTGATIAWLKDQLKLVDSAQETEALATAVPDNGGVYMVPAFVGLSAPYWAPDSRAAIVGLSPHSDKRHVVRAALESIAYQVREVLDLMVAVARVPLQYVCADGGMVSNKFLMKFVADTTRLNVRASTLPELSALGAVLCGALGTGQYSSLEELEKLPHEFVEYHPCQDQHAVEVNYGGWKKAVQRVL
jgi:glycerol kinase